MTIVLDLDRFEQRVRLRSAGFESCVVTPPEFVAELRLAGHYRHPWRTRASVFVDELLTLTVEPALTAAQARTLPGDDRARLRRAVVATYGCERDWRALYSSHLSADERLLAVMYWQWRNRQVSVRRMTGAHRAQANSLAGELIPSVSVPTDLAARMAAAADISAAAASTQALVPGGIAANFDLDELVSPAALGAVKALEMQKAVASDIAKRFELPSLKAFEHITRLTQTMKAFDNLRALSKTSVIGGISNLGGINNLGAFARTGMDTSVAAAITRRVGWQPPQVDGRREAIRPAGADGLGEPDGGLE